MLCGLAILRKLIKNNLAFFVFGISMPFFFWMIYHYNSNTTPSHGGLRYFPVFLLAAVLIWMKPVKQYTIASILAICLAWLWSFEAAIYSTVIYIVFLIAQSASLGSVSTPREVVYASLKAVGKLILLFVAFVITVALIYLILTGKIPRYDLYLSLVLSYVGTDPFMDYTWFQPGFYAWAPVLISYFVGICLVARQCFCPTLDRNPDWLPRLGVLVALGVTVSTYCIISTQTFILKPVLLPFYILLYWAYEITVVKRPALQFIAASELGLAPVILLLGYLLAGVSVGNFSPPPVYGSPNSNVLRLAKTINQHDFLERLHRNCSLPGVVEPGIACSKISLDEFQLLIDRWQRNDAFLLTFHPEDTVVTVLFKKPHRFPLSMSYVDGFSPRLFQNILIKSRHIMLRELNEGQTVIATKDLSTLNNLEFALLNELLSLWTLEKVDETEHLAVYKLVKNPRNAVGVVLGLPNRPVATRNYL